MDFCNIDNNYTYVFDGNGNLIFITDPEGSKTIFDYDLMDRLTTVTDRLGKTITYSYDNMDRLIETSNQTGDINEIVYNNQGQPVKFIDPLGRSWKRNYDSEGILVSLTDPMGKAVTFESNKLGKPVKLTNPLGNLTSFAYDSMGRVTAITDALGNQISFSFDALGLISSLTTPVIGKATYHRNDLGLLSEITDLNGKRWSFDYTAMGRLSSKLDPLGQQINYTYDELSRLSKVTYPAGNSVTLTYDTAGNITKKVYTGGLVVTYTYDSSNRVLSANNVRFNYDLEGRVVKTTDTSDDQTFFDAAYNDAGRLSSVSYNNGSFLVCYEYDSRNLLTQVTDSLTGTQITLSYDNDSKLTSMNRSNGVKSTFTWDNASRLIGIKDGSVSSMEYTLDAVGKVTNVSLDIPLDPVQFLVSEERDLSFDNAGQIDSEGYAYDKRGRLKTSKYNSYTWDEADRLIKTAEATLTYNGFDDLIERNECNLISHYYYNYAISTNPVVAEKHENTFKKYYIWTPDGTILYMIDASNNDKVYFYHFDRGGNILFLTDKNGEVSDAYAYSSYGRLLAHEGDTEQPFTFVGKYGVRQEGYSGTLYHMRDRYYDAATCRFLSRDADWPNLLMAQEINPYQYASQNPISFIDPDGKGRAKLIGKMFKELAGFLEPTKIQTIGNLLNGTPENFMPGVAALKNGEGVSDITGDFFAFFTVSAYTDAVGIPCDLALKFLLKNIVPDKLDLYNNVIEQVLDELERDLKGLSDNRREAYIKFLKKNTPTWHDALKSRLDYSNSCLTPVGGPCFDPFADRPSDRLMPSGALKVGILSILGIGKEASDGVYNTVKKVSAWPFRHVEKAGKWLGGK